MKDMKRAERRSRTQRVVDRRRVFVETMYEGFDLSDPRHARGFAKRLGQCQFRHPHDCGHAQCYCCHSVKIDDIPSRQQIEASLQLKEWRAGANEGE